MNYFRNLPDILYPSFNKESSSHDYTKIKNFFRRAYIPESILSQYVAFQDYKIIGDDRPDVVAQKYYNNSNYDWLIFITNNIQNIRTDWPMTQIDLNNYLFDKYTEQELSEIHHYETREVRNSQDHVILRAGIRVSPNYIFKYTEEIGNNLEIITLNPVVEITNYEHEVKVNDDKRSIVLLRPEYTALVEKELSTILRYKPSSSFVDEFTIRTEDRCIPPI
jgi:hypothetical protein